MVVNAQTMIGLHFPMSVNKIRSLHGLLSKYRVRCIGSAALTATYVATGYLTGVIDYKVKIWDIAAAYAICSSVGIIWKFCGDAPFPLRTFHPNMRLTPYCAGSSSFMKELENL